MLPIPVYYCLNWACRPFQPTAMALSDSYYSPASPTYTKQNLLTLTPSWNAWVSIQSFLLRRYASASSSGFPANNGLKSDQFNCGTRPCCSGSTTSCAGVGGDTTGFTGGTEVLQVVVVVLVVHHWTSFFISYGRII